MTNEERDAARARDWATRTENLAAAHDRLTRKVKPDLEYRCGYGRSRCLMLAGWVTPRGTLVYSPAVNRSASQADRELTTAIGAEYAVLLSDLIASADGAGLSNLAACRHYSYSILPGLLTDDDQAARSGKRVTRRIDRDTPGVVMGYVTEGHG